MGDVSGTVIGQLRKSAVKRFGWYQIDIVRITLEPEESHKRGIGTAFVKELMHTCLTVPNPRGVYLEATRSREGTAFAESLVRKKLMYPYNHEYGDKGNWICRYSQLIENVYGYLNNDGVWNHGCADRAEFTTYIEKLLKEFTDEDTERVAVMKELRNCFKKKQEKLEPAMRDERMM